MKSGSWLERVPINVSDFLDRLEFLAQSMESFLAVENLLEFGTTAADALFFKYLKRD